MSLSFRELIHISRPRFRLYTAGPFLVGVAATGRFSIQATSLSYFWQEGDVKWIVAIILIVLTFLVYLFYFLFPANLLIYGVNDIADEDTDLLNAKKQGYELLHTKEKTQALTKSIKKRALLPHGIALLLTILFAINETVFMGNYALNPHPHYFQLLLLPLLTVLSWSIYHLLARWCFYATSIFYSLPPVRAKAKPFLDGILNVLYILPGLIGFLRFGGSRDAIYRPLFVAAWLRCMAMHAYSAIPDIEPDAAAGLKTTAVMLGKQKTLLYCNILWWIAAILSMPFLGRISVWGFTLYTLLILLSQKTSVFSIYKRFPTINGCLWCIIFLYVARHAATLFKETI